MRRSAVVGGITAALLTLGALSLQANSNPPPIDLVPPGGVPIQWVDAGGTVSFGELYDDDHPQFDTFTFVSLNMHNMPCLTWDWDGYFYTLYLSIEGEDTVRGPSFNSDCFNFSGNVRIGFSNFEPPADWLDRTIDIEVHVEEDDGVDGGFVVLEATYVP